MVYVFVDDKIYVFVYNIILTTIHVHFWAISVLSFHRNILNLLWEIHAWLQESGACHVVLVYMLMSIIEIHVKLLASVCKHFPVFYTLRNSRDMGIQIECLIKNRHSLSH
jgi:hypothetical protein